MPYDEIPTELINPEHLNLGRSVVCASNIATLVGFFLNRYPIKRLNLSGNQLGNEGVINLELCLGRAGAKIEQLYLSHNQIGDEGLKAFQFLRRMPIKELFLSNNKFGPEGTKVLFGFLEGSMVEELFLSGNHLGLEDMRAFEALIKTYISVLHLSFNDIGDDGAQVLGNALIGSRVQKVYVSYNNIGNAGAVYLIQSLSKAQVEEIDLSHNKIDDECAEALGTALSKSGIQFVNLMGNSFSAEGTAAFARATKGGSLTTICGLPFNEELETELYAAKKRHLSAITVKNTRKEDPWDINLALLSLTHSQPAPVGPPHKPEVPVERTFQPVHRRDLHSAKLPRKKLEGQSFLKENLPFPHLASAPTSPRIASSGTARTAHPPMTPSSSKKPIPPLPVIRSTSTAAFPPNIIPSKYGRMWPSPPPTFRRFSTNSR